MHTYVQSIYSLPLQTAHLILYPSTNLTNKNLRSLASDKHLRYIVRSMYVMAFLYSWFQQIFVLIYQHLWIDNISLSLCQKPLHYPDRIARPHALTTTCPLKPQHSWVDPDSDLGSQGFPLSESPVNLHWQSRICAVAWNQLIIKNVNIRWRHFG